MPQNNVYEADVRMIPQYHVNNFKKVINIKADFRLYNIIYMFPILFQKREKTVLAFYTTLFQPEHLNIKLNTGELFSLLILNYCKMYKFC